jgi:hypothetical protein
VKELSDVGGEHHIVLALRPQMHDRGDGGVRPRVEPERQDGPLWPGSPRATLDSQTAGSVQAVAKRDRLTATTSPRHQTGAWAPLLASTRASCLA